MKVSDLYAMPLAEALKKMELADVKIHTDEKKNVRAVELKYTDPKEQEQKPTYRYNTNLKK